MLAKHCPAVFKAISSICTQQAIAAVSVSSSNSLQLRLAANYPAHRRFCSSGNVAIGVVDYAAIKKLPNEPKKLLIDVREPDELKETGQIPSSINIPLGIVSQELGSNTQLFKSKYGREKPQPDTEIIFHCKIGRRSLKAAEAAAALGYKNVKNYEGSWQDWAEREGLPKQS